MRWEGKGKEYKLINNKKELIYEGEYKNGKKWNGKIFKFNSLGRKIFEGEIKDGSLIILNRNKKERKIENIKSKQNNSQI